MRSSFKMLLEGHLSCMLSLIHAFRSDLVVLIPEVVQSDGLHGTVVAKPAAEHFLQHADQVHVMLGGHRIVVVEV